MNHAETFFAAAAQICREISFASIEALTSELDRLRERNVWLFLMASAAAPPLAAVPSMMVRKLCGIKTCSPGDNISELTARTHDEGWDTVFASWLDPSHLSNKDSTLIYSASAVQPCSPSRRNGNSSPADWGAAASTLGRRQHESAFRSQG